MPRLASSLLLALLVSACATETPPDAESTDPELQPALVVDTTDASTDEPVTDDPVTEEESADGLATDLADRPETLVETILVEGMEEAVTLQLAQFPDAPLPFSTYLPEGWTADLLGSHEGTAVHMTTGEPPYEATLSLFVPAAELAEGPGTETPGATTEAEVTALARSVAESRGTVQPLESPADWVRTGYLFREGDVVGTVRVAEHAGAFFYITESYPAEMGDGVAPATALILDRLRWDDDGTGL